MRLCSAKGTVSLSQRQCRLLHVLPPLAHAGLPPARGVLLHGPSGTGKTTLALALARQTGLNAVVVNAAAIRSKVIGASEAALARLVAQARAARPALLLIDQLEALAQNGVRLDAVATLWLAAAPVVRVGAPPAS